MPLPTPAFRAWTDAERAAEEAERRFYDLIRLPQACIDSQTWDAQLASTNLLRQRAHELFASAMHEMRALAESMDHRQLLARCASVSFQRLAPYAAGASADDEVDRGDR